MCSVSWTGLLRFDDDALRAAGGEVRVRRTDVGLSEWRTRLQHVRQGIELLWYARRARCLVVCNAMIEVLVVSALRRLIAPRLKVVAFDFLLPDIEGARWLPARLLRYLDHIVCIRSQDIGVIERHAGVDPGRISFLALPADPALFAAETDDGGYVYSGGNTQRDWPTLVAALGAIDPPVRAVFATHNRVDLPAELEGQVELLGHVSPEQGRDLVRRASVVALVHHDTDLAHGPLVLLDAMALGKAVVTTATGGTVDYVSDGCTGVVVPPRDPDALADALRRLIADPELRAVLGQAARTECAQRFTPAVFTGEFVSLVDAACDGRTNAQPR